MGKGTDTRGNIAAIAGIVHIGLFNFYLTEGVIDVSVLAVGHADNGQLAGQGIGAAKAVDLTAVRAAEDGQDDLIPGLGVFGKIVAEKVYTFTGSAAHDHAGNPFHFRAVHNQDSFLARIISPLCWVGM